MGSWVGHPKLLAHTFLEDWNRHKDPETGVELMSPGDLYPVCQGLRQTFFLSPHICKRSLEHISQSLVEYLESKT